MATLCSEPKPLKANSEIGVRGQQRRGQFDPHRRVLHPVAAHVESKARIAWRYRSEPFALHFSIITSRFAITSASIRFHGKAPFASPPEIGLRYRTVYVEKNYLRPRGVRRTQTLCCVRNFRETAGDPRLSAYPGYPNDYYAE